MFTHKFLEINDARVAKLADAPDLGSGGEILRGSSPLPGIARDKANAQCSTLNVQRPIQRALVEMLDVECSALKIITAQAILVRGNVSWFPIDGFHLEMHSHFVRVLFLRASDRNGARD